MNSKVTIIIPVSRREYLHKLFYSLETLKCDVNNTSLLVIVDGSTELFVHVRNKVSMSKFKDSLCIRMPIRDVKDNIYDRRDRICEIHNFAKEQVNDVDYVFCIEDDTIVPSDALAKLKNNYALKPWAGFIEGVEMGRRDTLQYIGAWSVDNIYDIKEISSLAPSKGLKEIDAGGFYCFMTRAETYKSHVFKNFENHILGPDVEFGLSLRKQGYSNYIDWSIDCSHLTGDEVINLRTREPIIVKYTKHTDKDYLIDFAYVQDKA